MSTELTVYTISALDVRYYRNIDRCAYGGLSNTQDNTLKKKRVYGADVYAVDAKCFNAFYYDEGHDRWVKYNSVSWLKFHNLFCVPHSKWKQIKIVSR